MPRRALVPALFLAAFAPLMGSTGCDETGERACTLIACEDQFTLSLVADDGPIPSGRYAVTVSASGAAQTRAFTLGACDGGRCLDGEALYEPDDERVLLFFDPVAADVTVRVERDGAVVSDGAAGVAFEDVFPNGPDCGGDCRVGRSEVAVD